MRCLVEDVHAGRLNEPEQDGSVAELLAGRADVVSAAGWQAIDAHERAAGAVSERPRVKLAERDALLAVAAS